MFGGVVLSLAWIEWMEWKTWGFGDIQIVAFVRDLLMGYGWSCVWLFGNLNGWLCEVLGG